MAKRKAKRKPKKDDIRYLKKGQSCGKGWTPITIKVGKTTRRACVRGKARRVQGFWERLLDAAAHVAISS